VSPLPKEKRVFRNHKIFEYLWKTIAIYPPPRGIIEGLKLLKSKNSNRNSPLCVSPTRGEKENQ